MATDGKVLDGDGGEKAFGQQVFPFWILLIGIFLFDVHLEDTISPVDGSQLEIFQDKLR